VPERFGGRGADYETYCLVAELLAQGNASTALTFNMHCLTMLNALPHDADDGPDRRQHADVRDGARTPRDSRAAALMRPWTQEIATQQAWDAALGLDGQRGASAGA
jgi:alkylation response protein AidB-like acyl-CoA dehydrogenase